MKKRKVILAMQMSLDGHIEGPNGEMDWLVSGYEDWKEMFTDLASVDTFLLGRKMYPGYAGFWRSALTDPSSSPDLRAYAQLADRTPHIVFTKGDFKPDWKNTRVAKDPAEEIARLRKQEGKDIVIWGGAAFASSMIDLGLVDEYRIALNPTVLGRGKALFGSLKEVNKLKLLDVRPLPSGIVVLRYQGN